MGRLGVEHGVEPLFPPRGDMLHISQHHAVLIRMSCELHGFFPSTSIPFLQVLVKAKLASVVSTFLEFADIGLKKRCSAVALARFSFSPTFFTWNFGLLSLVTAAAQSSPFFAPARHDQCPLESQRQHTIPSGLDDLSHKELHLPQSTIVGRQDLEAC